MASSVRKNTVKLVFGPATKVPTYLEVLKFAMENLKLSAADIHSIYKDENGGQFYVKLVNEETFAAFISDTDEIYGFKFDDGSTVRVRVEQASRIFRYVRIFNLPPEIEDKEIQYVLGQYGTIRQHVRERFPSEMKVNIFTGVRGLHMEVAKEIPAHLYVGHFRVRIFYDGLKNKCFYCKVEGHMKQNCPKLAAISTGSGSSTQTTGAVPLGRPVKPVIDQSEPMASKMTTLNSKNNVVKSITATVLTNTMPELGSSVSGLVVEPTPNTSTTKKDDQSPTNTPIPTTSFSNNTNSAATTEDIDDHFLPEFMEDEVSEQDRLAKLKRTKNGSPDDSGSDSPRSGEKSDKASPPEVVPDSVEFIQVKGKRNLKKKKT